MWRREGSQAEKLREQESQICPAPAAFLGTWLRPCVRCLWRAACSQAHSVAGWSPRDLQGALSVCPRLG